MVLRPTTYHDARTIGEALRSHYLVVLDISAMDADDSYRLVDFVSGLVFGLGGNIDIVTSVVLLLVPAGVTAMDDAEQLTGSFFNQS